MSIRCTVALAQEMAPRLFDLDFQLLADAVLTVVAVFVLFLALSYFLFNPARRFMQARQERIAGEIADAKAKEEDAAKLKAEYEEKISHIEKEADEILGRARKKALDSESRIVAEAREEAARIIAHANVEARLQKEKVADEVKREMIVLAAAMAGKIAAVSLDEEKQNRFIEETLAEIGENTWLS